MQWALGIYLHTMGTEGLSTYNGHWGSIYIQWALGVYLHKWALRVYLHTMGTEVLSTYNGHCRYKPLQRPEE